MDRSNITPLVLTFNEEPNLARALAQLTWANEAVVLDSLSTDGTESIARSYSNVRYISRAFDSHVAQWTVGVGECRTDWVLALDADYRLSDELIAELKAVEPEPEVAAYFCKFQYCIQGHPLRGSLYPPRAVLFRKKACSYVQDGHTQRLESSGGTRWLKGVIYHDDRKPISRWLKDQDRYAKLEVEKLGQATPGSLSWPDRIRQQIVVAPLLVFVHLLVFKGLFRDGWPAWIYLCQRTIAEAILSLRLAESRLVQRR